jgi:hypothetical protein
LFSTVMWNRPAQFALTRCHLHDSTLGPTRGASQRRQGPDERAVAVTARRALPFAPP